ncbi:hypothetical protein, partial [Vibrio cholerae]|uniref:hypothetical protein n=1 Tax=Vibrio cholerae TaxID=666 RepID=UPI00307FF2AF
IVLRPVSYLFFRFAHVTTALTVTRDQITELGKGSTYLGNNAPLRRKLHPNLPIHLAHLVCFSH